MNTFMRIQKAGFICLALVLAVTLAMHQGIVTAQETAPPRAAPETDSSLTVSDLVSSSTRLSERLSVLRKNLELGFVLSDFQKYLSETEAQVKALSARLEEMKTRGTPGYEKLSEVKMETVECARQLEERYVPLAERIKEVEDWGSEWVRDEERLLALESSLAVDESSDALRPTIARVKQTIDEARKLISENLNDLLKEENRAADIRATANSLVAEIGELLEAVRGDLLETSATSMFSSAYFDQVKTALGENLKENFEFVSASKWETLQKHASIIALQMALWLISSVIIIRNRNAFAREPRLLPFSKRPFTVGFLIGFVAFYPVYEPLGVWRVANMAMAGLFLARVIGFYIAGPWRRWGIYGMMIALIINEFLQVSDFPMPLFRLYILLASLIGFFLCLWRLSVTARDRELLFYRWALGVGVLVYGMIVVADVTTYSVLAAHLFEASLKTVLLFVLAWLIMVFARGTLELVSKSALVARVPLLQKNASGIVGVSSRLFNWLAGGFVTLYLLVNWGLFDNGPEAFRSIMSSGITIGSWRASLGLILTALLCIYGASLISRVVQSILVEEVFPKRRMQRGVQLAMGRLLHYAILLVGFLVAVGTLGVNFTNITIIGGALGVGIGFGLQNIVNNFLSGLILLFERPVRVGDYVELGGLWAEIKNIGLRATVVQTFDRADVIVPNSDLISNQVINWTLSNRLVRLRVPVGVAYGSDVELVMKILMECAHDNPSVVSSPEPQTLFMGFGDSSLNFELRVFVLDIDQRLIVHSELLQDIDKQFHLNGVEIPFPQRDLHLRSVDESAAAKLLGQENPA